MRVSAPPTRGRCGGEPPLGWVDGDAKRLRLREGRSPSPQLRPEPLSEHRTASLDLETGVLQRTRERPHRDPQHLVVVD